MSPTSTLQEVHRDLARKLAEEARTNAQSIYAGKFVGFAKGKVVAVADNWDELARLMEHAEPDPAKTFCVEIGRDYDEIQEIWGLA